MSRVSIRDEGRCGTVTYDEGGGRRLAGYWEFGGDDVVACVRCGSAEEWANHPWALPRRAEILQTIAAEVVRQKAPTCVAEVDAATGVILLKSSGAAPAPPSRPTKNPVTFGSGSAAVSAATRAEEAKWVFRLTDLRMKLGLVVLALAVLLGAGVWFKDTFLSIDPGKGTAIGDSVRTDRHVATLIETREPYMPSLHRNPDNDRYSVSLFLVPLDGSEPRRIPLRSGLAPGASGTAKIFGSDGRTLWFNVAGLGGVRLADFELLGDAELANVDPRSLPRPWGVWPMAPDPDRFVDRDALGASAYLDAGLLQAGLESGPIRFEDPPGSLLLFTSMPGPKGTAVIARVDDAGTERWRVDTGIGRFGLRQILPGESTTAFVGTRPAVPGEVSEPLLVIVEHGTGRQATHSLWQ